MVKEKEITGLSRELIIHPGETLLEVIEDRNMTQRELAIRTGMTEKHISTVINGQKGISASFARKLEYALGIETTFWMNLQSNYEREMLEFEEVNNISEEELGILKNLKEVIACWTDFGWLDSEDNPASQVLDLRMMLGTSNLLDVPKLSYFGAYRAQTKNNIDPYVLFSWQRMCEVLAKDDDVAEQVDIDKLREKIPEIKQVMFLKGDQIQKNLRKIFADCGIAFRIVPNFKKAPVQGFIKKTDEGTLILCITLRQKFADIFWFTLFHEIAHILNGDMKSRFVDFDSVSNEAESKADVMACDFLIDEKEFEIFVETGRYKSEKEISRFAEKQQVKDFVVKGRLMKKELIPWGDRLKYSWA